MANSKFLKKIFSRYLGNAIEVSNYERKEVQALCLVTKLLKYEELFLQSNLHTIGNLIDKYYAIVAQEIMQHNGSVDNFHGEYILCFFGLYEQTGNVEEKAVKSAKKIYDLLKTELSMGLGICGGKIIHGRFGSDKRATVTGFGLPINCAVELSGKNSGINICNTVAQLAPQDLLRHDAIKVFEHKRVKKG